MSGAVLSTQANLVQVRVSVGSLLCSAISAYRDAFEVVGAGAGGQTAQWAHAAGFGAPQTSSYLVVRLEVQRVRGQEADGDRRGEASTAGPEPLGTLASRACCLSTAPLTSLSTEVNFLL